MKKKIMSIILVVVVAVTFLFPVSAKSDKDIKKRAIEIAELWAKDLYEESVSVKDVIEMCDVDDNTMGYCISYKHGNTPKGYIVIDVNRPVEECIVEYCLEGDNIYYTLLDNVSKKANGRALGHELKIYCYEPFSYAIEVEVDEQEKYYSTENKYIDKDDNENFNNTDTISNGIMDRDEMSGTEIVNQDSLNGNLSSITPITTATYGGSNNCGPTALTNVIILYHDLYGKNDLYRENNLEWSYDRLLAWLEVGGYYTPANGTTRAGYPYALSNYVKEENSSYRTQCYELTANSLTDIVVELGNNYPMITSINYGGEGHAVVTIGYMTRANAYTLYRYIRVLDGWNASTQRYLNYDYYDGIYTKTARILG